MDTLGPSRELPQQVTSSLYTSRMLSGLSFCQATIWGLPVCRIMGKCNTEFNQTAAKAYSDLAFAACLPLLLRSRVFPPQQIVAGRTGSEGHPKAARSRGVPAESSGARGSRDGRNGAQRSVRGLDYAASSLGAQGEGLMLTAKKLPKLRCRMQPTQQSIYLIPWQT